MTNEQIVSWILSCVPSVIAVLTMLGTVLKAFSQLRELKKEVVDLKCFEDLKAQIGQLINENYELKSTINELLSKIDHIKRN